MSQNKSQPAKKPAKESYYIKRCKALLNLAQCKGIHPHFRAVMAYLVSVDNNTYKASWKSQETIATALDISRRTVIRAMMAAEMLSAIEILYDTRAAALAADIPVSPSGNYQLNVIRLHLAWDGFIESEISKADAQIIDAMITGRASRMVRGAGPSQRCNTSSVSVRHSARCRSVTALGAGSSHEPFQDKTTLSGQGEPELEALCASHSQDESESERSYRPGKEPMTDQAYIIPDDLPDLDEFLKFLDAFHDYNPKRTITPKLVASLAPHWMDSTEFRPSWRQVMMNIWDSEGIKKSFPEDKGGLNPQHLFAIKTSDMLGSAPVWKQILKKAMYWNYKTRSPI